MRVFVLALLVLAIPATTQAQDRRQAAALRNIEVHGFQEQFTQAMHTNALEEQQDRYRDTQNPRRVRRAEQAATMINAGDCDGARRMATLANDDRLRLRIDQVCSPNNAMAPATAPTGQ